MSRQPDSQEVSVAVLVKEALQGAGIPMSQLATDSGVSYGTLRAWSVSGVREPEPENLSKLADAFRRRAETLAAFAEQLERAARAGKAA